MALAYAIVFVDEGLYRQQKADSVARAQAAADERFERLAVEARKTLVTRNPEPHVMTYPEMRNHLPTGNLDGLVGLRFTADIS